MRILILFLLLIFCFSCHSGKKDKSAASHSHPSENSLIEMNKNLISSDIMKIDEYLSASGHKMNKSGTGLYYDLVIDKKGDNANPGDRVIFKFNLRNIEGKLIYSSDDLGLKDFMVDKTEVESGLNEAAKIMSLGDSAVLILPPHLAFRNIGDRNKIGPGEILIYELRLESLIRQEGKKAGRQK